MLHKNDFTRKMNDFNTLTKLPKNVVDLGKIIVSTGFEWLPKAQKIAQRGHTAYVWKCTNWKFNVFIIAPLFLYHR